jgi:MFS family permease
LDLLRKSYGGLSRETWMLAAVTLVNRSGMMVLPFLTVYLISALNFSISQAGIISAFFGLGSMTGSYSGGWLSDRFGYFSVQLGSLIIGGISCVCLAFLKGFTPLCIGMFITSALLDTLRPAMSAAISSFARQDNLTRSFSLIRMAINLGAGIGPAAAGILAGHSFSLIFIGDGLTSIAAGIVLYFYFHLKIKETKFKKKTVAKNPSPIRSKSYIVFLVLTMMYAIVFFQLFCTLPIYYDQVHHLLKEETGYLIAMNGLIVFVFEMMLVFKLENAVHPKKIIIIGVTLAGLGLVMLNFFHSGIILVISMIVLSFSEIFAMPFMMTVAVSRADATNRGTYTGIYSTAWSAAFILGPIIGTRIVTHFGFETLWWTMGAISILVVIGMWLIVPRVYRIIEPPLPQKSEMEKEVALNL